METDQFLEMEYYKTFPSKFAALRPICKGGKGTVSKEKVNPAKVLNLFCDAFF